jgi:hypothetical protein
MVWADDGDSLLKDKSGGEEGESDEETSFFFFGLGVRSQPRLNLIPLIDDVSRFNDQVMGKTNGSTGQ